MRQMIRPDLFYNERQSDKYISIMLFFKENFLQFLLQTQKKLYLLFDSTMKNDIPLTLIQESF